MQGEGARESKSIKDDETNELPLEEVQERLAQYEAEALHKTAASFNGIRQTHSDILDGDTFPRPQSLAVLNFYSFAKSKNTLEAAEAAP